MYGDLLVGYRADPERWLSYSRRKSFYASLGRYRQKALTFTTITRFIENAVKWENIEHQQSSPGQRGTQSRMRLLHSTARGLEHVGATLSYELPELVILRDSHKKYIDYIDDDAIRLMRSNLFAINEALAGTELAYRGDLIRIGNVLDIDRSRIVAHKTYRRIFNNGSFDQGGRFYGPFWQSISKDERQHITIDGCLTVERDYSQLHPRLLYAIGDEIPDGDAYGINGWRRPLVKQAMNTLINASTQLSAKRSIANAIRGHGAFDTAQALTDIIMKKHHRIAASFGSGAGLRLMKINSEMAESIQLKLIERGIVSLSIHDSFIVKERHAGVLDELMTQVLDLMLRNIGGNRRRSIGFSEKVPQYGDRVSLSWAQPGHAVEPETANDNLVPDKTVRCRIGRVG